MPSIGLLDLPDEIIEGICAVFADETAPESYIALASLRLTCKRLERNANSAYFNIILLDRRSDGLFKLSELSNNESLRGHVQGSRIELEPVFDKSRPEWEDMIATHTVRSVDTVDCDAAAACLTLLASICGSMAMGDKNVAWQSYESARKLEKELNDMPMHVLLTYLGAAFSRLPSLTELQCTANTGSRYCHRLLEYHPTELSSILQATGSYPCFRGHFQAHLRTPASEYSAAAIISHLLFCPDAESLTLDGITASTLNTMLFAIPTLPLALPIEELVLDPFLHPILEENNAKMLEVFESLLRRMPLLEKLRYVPYAEARHCAEPDLDLYFDYYNTFCDDKPLPCLPDPDAISGRLSCLELGSLYCSSVQLTKMLRSLSKSLKRLDLGLMFLHGGYWVEVFHFIRQHLENL